MKKLTFVLMLLSFIFSASFAQTVVKKTDKVKRTTTVPQKVHNIFSKHKHYSGYKTKHVKKVERVKS